MNGVNKRDKRGEFFFTHTSENTNERPMHGNQTNQGKQGYVKLIDTSIECKNEFENHKFSLEID